MSFHALGFHIPDPVTWRSVESMKIEQFSSFETSSEEEAKVETKKGKIVTLTEFVKNGGEEKMSGYKVCAGIEISENVGKVKVVVVEGEEEENGGEGCVVGMEGGEVEEEVEGVVNGERMVVDMGSELTKIMGQCEDVCIVMNVTYGLSNG